MLLAVAITHEVSMKTMFRLLCEYAFISQRKSLEWLLDLDAEKLPNCFPKCLSRSTVPTAIVRNCTFFPIFDGIRYLSVL